MALLILNAVLWSALIGVWKYGWAITVFHPCVKQEAQQGLGWNRRLIRYFVRLLLSIGLFIGLLYLVVLTLPEHEAWWVIPMSLLAIGLSFILAVISTWNVTNRLFAPPISKAGRL